MIEAVIFDLDGVLTDTAVYHYHSWKAVAAKFNYNLTEHDNEKLKGVSRADSLKLILQWASVTLTQEEILLLLQEKNDHYLLLINELGQKDILPGVLDFLTLLESHHCAKAVGSSSKNAPFILEKLGLATRFAAVIDGNGVQRTKPDPEVFLNAAQKLGVHPERCLVIEDAPSGIQAAKAAGMKVVGIGHDLVQSDLCVPSLVGLGWDQIQKL
jgi:beta-phosphoglucomutase